MPDGSDANHDTDFRDTGKLIDIFLKGESSGYWKHRLEQAPSTGNSPSTRGWVRKNPALWKT